MIKILSCKNKNYLTKLIDFLDKRRSGKEIDTKIVTKILKDIKKNKTKALLKYEKKFSRNNEIKPSLDNIKKSIKSLDPKIKKAIDFAYSRIFKFHLQQRLKSISYKDVISNDLKVMDMTAVAMARENNLPLVVFDVSQPGNLAKILNGVKLGTTVI